MLKPGTPFSYRVRPALSADIPAIRAMQERSMWVLGGDFYTPTQIANFLTRFGTMDDAVVKEGHFFVAEDLRGAILGSGGWTCLRPAYAQELSVGEAATGMPTVRSVFVDPAATRRGIASAIMAQIENDALADGVDVLQLTATLSGAPLYKSFGYETEENTELILPDLSRFKCIKMRKSLVERPRRASA
ncbi:MAG: GNAT family N-acetyltransferase [Aquamicrobium sp.]|nr:GNAT family N-acetyltransferase [Aquamicrobium sp.]